MRLDYNTGEIKMTKYKKSSSLKCPVCGHLIDLVVLLCGKTCNCGFYMTPEHLQEIESDNPELVREYAPSAYYSK